MKTWLKYLLYIMAICILVFSRQYFMELAGMTFKGLFSIGAMILNVLLGALLGAEVLISEFKKEGYWKTNISKLVLVGLPSMFTGFSWLVLSGKSTFMGISVSAIFMNAGVFQLIFGYSVATSFYKKRKAS